MQATIFGTGYVGLVTGTCLAEVGNDVVCMDVAADRVARLNRGEVPFFEPGLPELVASNHAAGRLRFITDEKAAVAQGRVLFIAVGTPPADDGSADLSQVFAVARSIGRHLQGDAVIVVGNVHTNEYDGRDGIHRQTLEMRARAVGPDLSHYIVKLQRLQGLRDSDPQTPDVAAEVDDTDEADGQDGPLPLSA